MTKNGQTVVLGHKRIDLIIQRFAHQIYEHHHKANEIVIIGVDGRGYDVAKRINKHLSSISSQKLSLEKIKLDKVNPAKGEIELSLELSQLKGKTIILVDDVLNSGKTLVYALRHILGADLKSVTTVVLVDRIHRNYPIKADYVGMTLSTTLQERVEVELGKEDYAYLV